MITSVLTNKIIPQSATAVRKAVNTVQASRKNLSSGIKEGYEKGKRLSAQQKRGKIKTAQAEFVGIKRSLPPELWYGFLGTISIVPGGGVIGIGIGALIRILKQHKFLKI